MCKIWENLQFIKFEPILIEKYWSLSECYKIEFLQKHCILLRVINLHYKVSKTTDKFTAKQPKNFCKIVKCSKLIWFCSGSVQFQLGLVHLILSIKFFLNFTISFQFLDEI